MRQNLLEMCPVLREGLRLEETNGDATLVTLFVPRTSWLERLSIRFLKQPSERHIHLDALGSFVMRQCDGQKPVNEISQLIEAKFGEQAQPTLPRLVKFLQTIEAMGWIQFNPYK